MTESTESSAKFSRRLSIVTVNALIVVFMLVLVEGCASWLLAFRHIASPSHIAERRHTRYDPELGWINEANVYIRDMYGPGASFRTNSQAFRGAHDFELAVPAGKRRIICSGDSFTLGYGVADHDTWCHLLMSMDARLETVNMGQGGYGVDQMYLWYKRDGSKFQHNVQLLTFITDDFHRMQRDAFFGYGKPTLNIRNNSLKVSNVPVPRGGYAIPWITTNLHALSELRTIALTRRLYQRVRQREKTRVALQDENERTREILKLIFKDLKRMNEERSSTLAFVYLPVLEEVKQGYSIDGVGEDDSREWIDFIRDQSQELEVPFIDVVGTFRSLPYAELGRLFRGHLSEQGNAFVASAIYRELRMHPTLAEALAFRD